MFGFGYRYAQGRRQDSTDKQFVNGAVAPGPPPPAPTDIVNYDYSLMRNSHWIGNQF